MIKICASQTLQPVLQGKNSLNSPSKDISQRPIKSSEEIYGELFDSSELNSFREVLINRSQIEKQIQIYRWREKTEFPIVRIRSFLELSKKQPSLQQNDMEHETVCLQIHLEEDFQSLEDVRNLPFFQAIYLLKEILIGSERLFHRFGSFEITEKLIKISPKTQQCYVWVNQDLKLNARQHPIQENEGQFILRVCRILKNKTNRSKGMSQLFQKVQSASYFFEAIGYIDTYAKIKKIKIPTSLKKLENIKTPLTKSSLNIELLLKNRPQKQQSQQNIVQHRDSDTSSPSKIPSFLKSIKNKDSFNESPKPRKITSISEKPNLDRSMTNVSRNLSSNSFLNSESAKLKRKEKTLNNEEEEDFLRDMNIRLIEPTPCVRDLSGMVTPPPRLVTHFSLAAERFPSSPLRNHQKEELRGNANEIIDSPYGKVSDFGSQNEKRSGYSFNKSKKNSESVFEQAEQMFLTVIKPHGVSGNNCKSSISNNDVSSPHQRKKSQLKDIKSDEFESLEDGEFSNSQKVSENQQIDFLCAPSNKSNRSESNKKRKGSFEAGNLSNRSRDASFNNDQRILLEIPEGGEANLLKVPSSRRRKTEHYVSERKDSRQFEGKASSGRSGRKESEKSEDELSIELRETILNKNGWKGLALFSAETGDIKESFVDGKEIPRSSTAVTTKDLSKLGQMGREVKNSLISQNEFELEMGSKLSREKNIREEVMEILM